MCEIFIPIQIEVGFRYSQIEFQFLAMSYINMCVQDIHTTEFTYNFAYI